MSANGGKADMQRWSCFKKENEAQAELGRESRELLDATGLTCQLDDASLAQQICYDMIVDSRRHVVATSKSAIYEPPQKGFPYIVVTKAGDQCEVVIAKSRTEARKLVSEKVCSATK